MEVKMSFIGYVGFEGGAPELQRLYTLYGGRNKRPANIIRISGVNPPVMEKHVSLYRAIISAESPLSRHRQEMIAVVVSSLNGCHY
jgi:alkylhydroperoxidase family enzyme